MEDRYIYEDTEVALTGRKATRDKHPANRRRTEITTEETRVEITPADPEAGSWKKWVVKNDLFIIQAVTVMDDEE